MKYVWKQPFFDKVFILRSRLTNNFNERIEQKIFHAEIVVDNAAVARETKE